MSAFRLLGALFLWLGIGLLAAIPAAAEPRVALVIGNGNYGSSFSRLPNPPNDAKLVSKALKDAGFDVTTVTDANLQQIKRAFADFGQKLADKGTDAVGLFYYAGHGVQVDGANYLIPTGASIAKAADVDMEAVNADWVLQQMEFAGNRMNIIILDACRNNPLPASKRSAEKGLARMDAPKGSFLAYSTAPGATAVDGKGSNSPYSQALANAIENSRVPLEQLFRQVRVDVMSQTGEDQVPWDSSSLTGEFYFKRPDGSAPAQQTAAVTPAPAPAPAPAASAGTAKAPEPAVAPGKPFRDCPNCPELVTIPAGNFTMGELPGDDTDRAEEKPAHPVTFAKPFALMTKEVTRQQYAAFVKATGHQADGGCQASDGGDGKWRDQGSYLDPGFSQKDDHPVVCVSADDAAEYAAWLSQQTGKSYRLPTEAEWEYAARAGKKSAWPWGNDVAASGCKAVNAMDASGHKKFPTNDALPCDDRFETTAPVGSFPANAFGLYDMLGNVWEMVSDCWHDSYKGAPSNGAAWDDGSCNSHVRRGGAWLENPWDTRFAARWQNDGSADNTTGFRLARDF